MLIGQRPADRPLSRGPTKGARVSDGNKRDIKLLNTNYVNNNWPQFVEQIISGRQGNDCAVVKINRCKWSNGRVRSIEHLVRHWSGILQKSQNMLTVSSRPHMCVHMWVQFKLSVPPLFGLMPSVTWSTMIRIKRALTSTYDVTAFHPFRGFDRVCSLSHCPSGCSLYWFVLLRQ